MPLKFLDSTEKLFPRSGAVLVLGSLKNYQKGFHSKVLPEAHAKLFASILKTLGPSKSPMNFPTLTGTDSPYRIVYSILPEKVSKDNSPSRREWIYQQLETMEGEEQILVIVSLDDTQQLGGAITAIARRLRLVNMKKTAKSRSISVLAVDSKGKVLPIEERYRILAQETAWACQQVDLPPNLLNPKTYAKEIMAKFKNKELVTIKEIAGSKLVEEGLNGIYNVGKAAVEAPRLLILDYKPRGAHKTAVLAGKGVCFDSGGMSLKSNMVGMKGDMGGSAAVIGAFSNLIQNKYPHRLIAAVALVENAIGPTALRNDDVITMHSGKTVEVNNTDAEGRLLLADVLSYCGRKYKPQVMIDAATLTGAQMVATGLLHAAIISNRSDLESLAQKVGKESGDLVAPLPFAPELFQNEFKSLVADMVNSVKNRSNAQVSCAAQFIYSHIDDLDLPWIHIDMAGPSNTAGGVGTGYGIQLISRLAREYL